MYPSTSLEGIDLLRKMLSFSPRKRLTVDEALNHPFLRSKRMPGLEKTAATPMKADLESIGESAEHLFANVSGKVYLLVLFL